MEISNYLYKKIFKAFRKLTYTWPPRNTVKKRQKRGAALYECSLCGIYVYEGNKELSETGYIELYGDNVVHEKRVNMDHINPVVDPIAGPTKDLTELALRFFPEENGWQLLCFFCNYMKTHALENTLRREIKNNKKA